MRPLCRILFFFVVPYIAVGQRIGFAHLNVRDGLPHKSILALAQDGRGFMWLGTADGLYRYDSRHFKAYNSPPGQNGLPSSYILSLYTDSKQTLWVGTSNGLGKYNPVGDSIEPIQLPRGSDGKTIHTVNCITEDKERGTWIGTSTGLYLLQRTSNLPACFFAASNRLAGNNVHSVTVDHFGTVWVGTEKGLTKIWQEGLGFHFQIFRNDAGKTGSLAHNNVTSVAEDEYHNIWIGLQQKGLQLYSPVSDAFTTFSSLPGSGGTSENIRKIVSDKKGRLWIGTQDGLNVFDIANRKFTSYTHSPDDPHSLSQNSIYSLFIDKNQTLWVGTYFGGINIVIPASFKVCQSNSPQPCVSNNVVSSFAEDKAGNIWIGTEGGGLNYISKKGGQSFAYRHRKGDNTSIGSNLVKAVYKDQEGNIWAGTHGGGLNVLQAGKETFKRYLYNENDPLASNSEIISIAEGKDSLLWVGSNTGLHLFKKNNIGLTPYTTTQLPGYLGPQSQAINCFFLDAGKNMWIGGWGLYLLENGKSHISAFKTVYKQENPLGYARINCITGDKLGNIWIGTDREGLFKYNTASRQLTGYTEADGLANNNVNGIAMDEKGYIWISTRNGLSRLDKGLHVFHNYTISDGLAGNEFNKNAFLTLSDGEMLFGGFNGFTAFYPKNIRENKVTAATFITGLKLFGKPVTPGDGSKILSADISQGKTIGLGYTQNVFTIDFAVLNYVRPEKNRYAYKIEGVDKNWNYTDIPSATYNNLPPGKYLFLAKGSNNDGLWSSPASLLIVVRPPWWRTWWAYGLYTLALTAIVFLIIRFVFLQALIKKDKELTTLKLNFFTNISHEIRTYLSLIIGPVERLLLTKKEDDPDSPSLLTVRKNSEGLLQLVNELMDFRKAETGNLLLNVSKFNIVPFVQSVYQSFQDIALSKNIVTDFIPALSEMDVYFDKEQMRKVLFNLLSNAYKFTPEGGQVSIIVADLEDAVEIKVANNGKGVSPDNLERLFDNYFQENDYGQQNTGYGIGLALSKSIVELHKGGLKVKSNAAASTEEMNTTFIVTLRKGGSHFMKSQLQARPQDNPAQNETVIPTDAVHTHTGQKPYTLLLVEDNLEVRKFIAGSLMHLYEIKEASNGIEGFDIATELIPDIIISDVMMPEMDGFEFCGKIKADGRTNHIPVILLTAKSSVNNQANGLQMGADVYLTKPFSIQVLGLQVNNLLAAVERLRHKYSLQITNHLASDSPAEAINTPQDKILADEPVVQNEFISRIILLAGEHLSNPDFDIEMICRKMAMSQTALYKKVKALTGLTVNDIVKNVRLKKAAELMSQEKYAVYEVADMVGYNDTKYFSREFKKCYGVSPRDYKAPV